MLKECSLSLDKSEGIMMAFKPFSDLRDALGTLVKDVSGLADIPKKEREKYLRVLDETMSLLDHALLLMISRLGDLLNMASRSDQKGFTLELRALDNASDWYKIERDVRLCLNLRNTCREMSSLIDNLKAHLSLREPDEIRRLFYLIFGAEVTLADLISTELKGLAQLPTGSKEEYEHAVERVRQTRDLLAEERKRLISIQTEAYKLV